MVGILSDSHAIGRTSVTSHVTDEKKLKEAFQTVKERFGEIDVVVNNAGVVLENDWQTTFWKAIFLSGTRHTPIINISGVLSAF